MKNVKYIITYLNEIITACGMVLIENSNQEKWEEHEQLFCDIDWTRDELKNIVNILKKDIDNDNQL